MRSACLLVLAVAAAGCRSLLGIGDPPGQPDAAACETWHPTGIDPCAFPPLTDALTLGDAAYTYDTTLMGGTLYDADHRVVLQSVQRLAQAGGPVIDVLSIGELVVSPGARLTVIGPQPLVLLSWSSVSVDGAIDAGSHVGVTDAAAHVAQTVQFGPGANQGCTRAAGQSGGDATAAGSSGGGGGGGQAAGGAGGAGGDPPVGAGGAAVAGIAILGGCPGGPSGAAGSVAHPPAARGARALGGAGGGALHLVARDSIDVRGAISASGAGGAGAPTNSGCGAGGGGAGGYLGFEAPLVLLHGTITANGGGGGSGGAAGGTGNDGADGAAGTAAAAGGAAPASCGEAGGNGGASESLAGAAGSPAVGCGAGGGGGGGGGGASGIIAVRSPDVRSDGSTISPPMTIE